MKNNLLRCGIIVFFENSVVLVRNYNGKFSFPKGKQHNYETILETAVRELQEETGIMIKDILFYKDKNHKYIYIDEIKSSKGTIRYFVAELQRKVDLFLENENELDSVLYMNIYDALEIKKKFFGKKRKKILKTCMEIRL